MRPGCSMWLLLAWALAASGAPAADAAAADVPADAPTELSVTVYRAPDRSSGSMDLDRLNGFALVSEVRAVHLPAGESRLRFEGVADGIEPASAILTGLPAGVVEKNREGSLLSPSALAANAVGKPVVLLRTDPKTGRLTRRSGRILSAAEGGVVFETDQGIEGLRCSGLAETFSFAPAVDLSAHAVLSVRVQSPRPMTRMVTLTYLAHGFDWSAYYVATLSPDGTKMDLSAWVTLANGNGVGFSAAHTQVIAGRVNRENGEIEPIDAGGPILATCWPRGSTSDVPFLMQLQSASLPAGRQLKAVMAAGMAAPAPEFEEVVVDAQRVEQEQLGDLKLYRIPEPTTVASRQSKQVRLLDRTAIPVTTVYGADLSAGDPVVSSVSTSIPASRLLRATNDTPNHLGLPLPSGRVAVFTIRHADRLHDRLLVCETGLRDLAVDEDVEIDMGSSPDVVVSAVRERSTVDAAHAETLPEVPGVPARRSVPVDDIERIEISSARDVETRFELRLRLPEGAHVVRADHSMGMKNGRPIFRLTIPAHATATIRYQTQRAVAERGR
jgi:hypothetical protein